jgi:hypothetical protein
MGLIPFTVWNSAQAEEGTADRSTIVAPASNNASVKTAITLVLRSFAPRRSTDSTDPGKDVGDRARQEWRELTANFVDTDLTKLHSVIDKIYLGTPLVTCFLKDSTAGLKPGSMIRDQAGQPMFELAENGDIEAAKTKLEKRIHEEARTKLREVVLKDGILRLSEVLVKHPITEALDDNGFGIERISFADIEFSDPVKKASDDASAQEAERLTQIANAKAAKAARKELQPEKGEIRDELAMTLGAALDPGNKGNVKVYATTGGNALTSAALVGASEVKGD